jgi:hypothetical protein
VVQELGTINPEGYFDDIAAAFFFEGLNHVMYLFE